MDKIAKVNISKVTVTAKMRETRNCPLRPTLHKVGTSGCKCYIIDLGTLTPVQKGPITKAMDYIVSWFRF